MVAPAAERALSSSAYNEAIAHLEKALGIAAALADGPANRLLRLQLQTSYGYALSMDGDKPRHKRLRPSSVPGNSLH